MSNKRSLLLLLLLTITLVVCIELSLVRSTSFSTNRAALLTSQNDQEDFSEVEFWIINLRSYDENKREAAKKAIIAFSVKSPETRQRIIKELIKVATAERMDLIKSPPRFFAWREAVEILGTIKATETIDVLIDCLDCNNGPAGLGTGRYPAILAISKLGNEAIPKLADALDIRPDIRFRVAQALYLIGGDRAKDVLGKAMQKGMDKQTTSVIRKMLQNWNGSGKN